MSNRRAERAVSVVEGKPVYAKDIPTYFDDFFWSALHAWSLTKTWGLAHGTALGWAGEPREYIEAITCIEGYHNEWENKEIEKTQASVKK